VKRLLPLGIALALPFGAQAQTSPTVPATWKVRTDRGTPVVVADTQLQPNRSDTVRIVTMPPGWHVTTGPAMIAWDPAWQAHGPYRAELEVYLFPGDRAEGYGLFVGGRQLEEPDQAYLYVLLRKDGAVLVKRRAGEATETLVPWTVHPAIVPHTGQSETARNVLAVDVADDSIRVIVNDQPVTAVARADLPTDGQVGLRINHALNVHVTRVEVQEK
jgi:hypothetical protein